MLFFEVFNRQLKKYMIWATSNYFLSIEDAASAVLAHEKLTSLAELFSVELKFAVDTLNGWFSRIIKPKFFELDDIKKHIFKGKSNRSVQNNLFNLWVSTERRRWGLVWFCFKVRAPISQKYLQLRWFLRNGDQNWGEVQWKYL